jgi:hypothetical protein
VAQILRTVSGSVIVNFDFQFDAGAITNNDFMGLCTADLFVRTTGTSGQFFQNIALGTTYSIMGYLQKTGGSLNYNQFDL